MWKKLGFSIVVVLLLIGCGKKESNSPESSTPVTVQLRSGIDAESAGYYIALNKGFYMDEGLDVRISPGDWLSKPEDLVLSGNATFGITWLPRLMVLRDQGKPLTHLAQIVQKSSTRLVAKKSSGIVRPLDLLHRRVTLFPQGYDYEFSVFLGENGVGIQNIIVANDKYPGKALLENRTDMVSLTSYQQYLDFEKSKPLDMELLVYDGSTESWGLPQDCIFTTENTLKGKPDLCSRFVNATIKGWEYVLVNQKDSAGILKDFDKTNRLDIEREFNGIREFVKLIRYDENGKLKIGYLSPNEMNRVNQLLSKHRIINNSVSFPK